MEYEIIFYHSGKTAETERMLERAWRREALQRKASSAALRPEELAECLAASLQRVNLVIIIGGLDGGRQSTDTILSLILSARSGELQSEKLLDDDDRVAYVIRAGQQTLLVFPDEPDVIATMLEHRINGMLQKRYQLSDFGEQQPALDTVTSELARQLAGMNRAGGSYAAAYAEKQQRELKKMRLLIGILLSVGAVLLIIAILLFFQS